MKWFVMSYAVASMTAAAIAGYTIQTDPLTESIMDYTQSTDMTLFRHHLNYRYCEITNSSVSAIEQIIWEELKVRICGD